MEEVIRTPELTLVEGPAGVFGVIVEFEGGGLAADDVTDAVGGA
jgi:hypothetical protein